MKSRTIERKVPLQAAEHPTGSHEQGLSSLIKSWDRFWFTPTDPICLGFLRIIGGILILYVHLCYTVDLLGYVGGDRAWTDTRVSDYMRKKLPIMIAPNDWTSALQKGAEGNFTWSIYYHVTDPVWVYTIHYTFLGIMVLFTIGLWTRTTSVLTWIGCLCYIQRVPTLLFGLDTMMVILVFYLMIGPSGATLSVDRLLEVWRYRKRYGPGLVPPVEPSVVANMTIRGMQIHFCIIYLAAGTSKLLGSRWWSGTALWACYANYSFAPLTISFYYDWLVFLCKHRWLWEIVMTSGAVFTLIIEIGFPFLVWKKSLRWVMVGGSVLLHVGIGMIMGLVTFSMFMLCLVGSFIPPEAIRQMLHEAGQPFKGLFFSPDGRLPRKDKGALAVSRI